MEDSNILKAESFIMRSGDSEAINFLEIAKINRNNYCDIIYGAKKNNTIYKSILIMIGIPFESLEDDDQYFALMEDDDTILELMKSFQLLDDSNAEMEQLNEETEGMIEFHEVLDDDESSEVGVWLFIIGATLTGFLVYNTTEGVLMGKGERLSYVLGSAFITGMIMYYLRKLIVVTIGLGILFVAIVFLYDAM